MQLRPHYLKAPDNFSLLENTEEFCSFINQVARELTEYGRLEIDHREVVNQTPEALALFISILGSRNYRRTVTTGKIPNDATQKQVFFDSGICDYLKLDQPFHHSGDAGNILKRRNHKVESPIAGKITQFAMGKLYGDDRFCREVYKTLIELMANTYNHAKGKRNYTEEWWVSVHYKGTGRVCFTFVDNGVGIFASVGATMRFYRKAAHLLGVKTNGDFLKSLLKGQLKSSTGLPNRGKGIPMIYDLAQKGKIENLTVLTNDVFARISANDFSVLKNAFSGTLWYWEISIPENQTEVKQ